MPKLKEMFKKASYITIGSTDSLETENKSAQDSEPSVPAGLWIKCPKCGRMLYKEDVTELFYVCLKCGGYFRIKTGTRLRMLVDKGSFEEWGKEITDRNALEFPGYEEKLQQTREKTHLKEAVTIGKAKINGMETVVGVCDARFLMSSMGYVVGERITAAFEKATTMCLPVVIFCCSGGARMQEGIISLMQMAKASAAIKKHSDAGLLYIPVLTDPTTGGVTASFAMLGDIILAEPGALIGFAGPRVIQQTIGQKLPEGFQRAEFLVEKGIIDGIVERKDLKNVLSRLIHMHSIKGYANFSPKNMDIKNEAPFGHPICPKSRDKKEEAPFGHPICPKSMDKKEESACTRQDSDCMGKNMVQETVGKSEPWERVLVSRMAGRPTSLDYITAVFDEFTEMHGDRSFRDDGAIVGGIAYLDGQPVTVIGQQKGKNTKENISRNFGMVSPEGYRKALRLMKQAEKFGRPIINFVDTPGAACGIEAEERGQGEAIARNLMEMSGLKTPVLSIVIGEGGSGGALGMAVANEVWMMENATYSILSPEGFATILWKDGKRAKEASEIMKITAADLRKLGIVELVIPEVKPAGEDNLPKIAGFMKAHMREFLERKQKFTGEEIAGMRYDRFRNM